MHITLYLTEEKLPRHVPGSNPTANRKLVNTEVQYYYGC